MTIINSADSRYAVEILNVGEKFIACAVICDNNSYGNSSYWFTIGYFKTIKMAINKSVKGMAVHGIELIPQ